MTLEEDHKKLNCYSVILICFYILLKPILKKDLTRNKLLAGNNSEMSAFFRFVLFWFCFLTNMSIWRIFRYIRKMSSLEKVHPK